MSEEPLFISDLQIKISSYDKANHDAVLNRIRDLITRLQKVQAAKKIPQDEYVWITTIHSFGTSVEFGDITKYEKWENEAPDDERLG